MGYRKETLTRWESGKILLEIRQLRNGKEAELSTYVLALHSRNIKPAI